MPTPPDPIESRRRNLTHILPALTRFYYGAITPLNIEQFTERELTEYIRQMEEATAGD